MLCENCNYRILFTCFQSSDHLELPLYLVGLWLYAVTGYLWLGAITLPVNHPHSA